MSSRKSKVMSLSLAQGVLMAVALVSGMVFSRTLSVTDYGTYLQTFLAYDFAVPLLTFGLPTALYYFLPGNADHQKRLVFENILLLLAAGMIFSLFLILGGTELLSKRFNNPDLSKTLKWMVFYPLYTFPVIVGTVLVIKDKINLNALYNAITGLILIISLIIAAFFTKSYEAPVLVRIFLPLAFFPLAVYLSFKFVPGKWEKPDLNSMWQMIKFAVPLGLASVLGTLTRQLANLIVSFLSTPKDFAIYANGAKEVPIIGIVAGSIAVITMADMSKKIKEGDKKSALELFRKASVVSACFMLPVMCFLMIYAKSFIDILYTSKYSDSVLPFRIYLLILPVRIVYYGSALIALGRSKIVLYRSIIELVITSVLCYFLVKWIGPYYAAFGLIITFYLWSMPYNLYTLGKDFDCNPTYVIPFFKLGTILLVSLVSSIVSSVFLFFTISSVLLLCLGAILFSIVYILLAFRFIPEFKEIGRPILVRLKITSRN